MSTACQRCEGCGRIADSDEGEPWTAWASLPRGSDLAVQLGVVKPVNCPACGGTGGVTVAVAMPHAAPTVDERTQAHEASLADLRARLEQLKQERTQDVAIRREQCEALDAAEKATAAAIDRHQVAHARAERAEAEVARLERLIERVACDCGVAALSRRRHDP